MSQIILVENNINTDTVFSLNLNTYLDAKVFHKKNHSEAIDLLQNNNDIKLIITRNIIENTKTAIEIFKFLKENAKTIPMIILGPEPLMEKHAIILGESPEVRDILKNAAQCLGITPKEMAAKVVPDYISIPIEFFLTLDILICPVYLRLKTSHGDQFIKRFNPKDSIVLEDAEHFIRKGIRELYVPKEHRLTLTNTITKQLLGKLNSGEINDDQRVTITSNSVDVLREQLKTAGFSQETVELAKSTIESVQKVINKIPRVKTLLEKIFANKSTYRYRMIQLVTYITFHSLKNMEWGTPEQQEKLAFVALMHDIIFDRDEWAMVRSQNEINEMNISDEERHIILSHATEAAGLVLNFPSAPLGIEVIIKQHHGAINGYGMPKNYSNNLSPLAIVFFICEEFAHSIVIAKSQNQDINFKAILDTMKTKYTKFLYKRVITTLENLEF
ncbi:MAG: hypothetical protein HQK49_15500 [Oligoflexia bacterium]|nr:hypothetical protein [Oligoflexia bacterium]